MDRSKCHYYHTNNVTYMSNMFSGCKSISSFYLLNVIIQNYYQIYPNVIQVVNIINMEGMFYEYSSLLSLSDISKWISEIPKILLI